MKEYTVICFITSHLLQMRGLKHLIGSRPLAALRVASFTDAWIETKSTLNALPSSSVASFTDAWIETIRIKPEFGLRFVASFTDAWIETGQKKYYPGVNKSHLLQMRGLKRKLYDDTKHGDKSHLLQMRGLKPIVNVEPVHSIKSHLLQMRGLKHAHEHKPQPIFCRIFYRCVD